MFKREQNILGLFEDGHLGKKGRKGLEERAKKIVNYAPEVMVKVSGCSYGIGHMASHLEYISRNGEIDIETQEGEIIRTKENLENLTVEWGILNELSNNRKSEKTRTTTNIVLSMPYGTDAKDVKDSVRNFARKQFGENYRYVMALHEDTDCPHVHLTVNNLGFDGKRLQIKKGDPQRWREAFAYELDVRGIDAEATPRATRGVVFKSVSQTIKHIQKQGIKIYRASQRADEMTKIWNQSKEEIAPRPWEIKIKEKQEKIRKSWLVLAEDFQEKDKEFSDKIIAFVEKMPKPQTRMERLNYRVFASVLKSEEKMNRLMEAFPELNHEVVRILYAEQKAEEKFSNPKEQKAYVNKVIEEMANKRLNGERAEPLMVEETKPRQRVREREKDRDIDYER